MRRQTLGSQQMSALRSRQQQQQQQIQHPQIQQVQQQLLQLQLQLQQLEQQHGVQPMQQQQQQQQYGEQPMQQQQQHGVQPMQQQQQHGVQPMQQQQQQQHTAYSAVSSTVAGPFNFSVIASTGASTPRSLHPSVHPPPHPPLSSFHPPLDSLLCGVISSSGGGSTPTTNAASTTIPTTTTPTTSSSSSSSSSSSGGSSSHKFKRVPKAIPVDHLLSNESLPPPPSPRTNKSNPPPPSPRTNESNPPPPSPRSHTPHSPRPIVPFSSSLNALTPSPHTGRATPRGSRRLTVDVPACQSEDIDSCRTPKASTPREGTPRAGQPQKSDSIESGEPAAAKEGENETEGERGRKHETTKGRGQKKEEGEEGKKEKEEDKIKEVDTPDKPDKRLWSQLKDRFRMRSSNRSMDAIAFSPLSLPPTDPHHSLPPSRFPLSPRHAPVPPEHPVATPLLPPDAASSAPSSARFSGPVEGSNPVSVSSRGSGSSRKLVVSASSRSLKQAPSFGAGGDGSAGRSVEDGSRKDRRSAVGVAVGPGASSAAAAAGSAAADATSRRHRRAKSAISFAVADYIEAGVKGVGLSDSESDVTVGGKVENSTRGRDESSTRGKVEERGGKRGGERGGERGRGRLGGRQGESAKESEKEKDQERDEGDEGDDEDGGRVMVVRVASAGEVTKSRSPRTPGKSPGKSRTGSKQRSPRSFKEGQGRRDSLLENSLIRDHTDDEKEQQRRRRERRLRQLRVGRRSRGGEEELGWEEEGDEGVEGMDGERGMGEKWGGERGRTEWRGGGRQACAAEMLLMRQLQEREEDEEGDGGRDGGGGGGGDRGGGGGGDGGGERRGEKDGGREQRRDSSRGRASFRETDSGEGKEGDGGRMERGKGKGSRDGRGNEGKQQQETKETKDRSEVEGGGGKQSKENEAELRRARDGEAKEDGVRGGERKEGGDRKEGGERKERRARKEILSKLSKRDSALARSNEKVYATMRRSKDLKSTSGGDPSDPLIKPSAAGALAGCEGFAGFDVSKVRGAITPGRSRGKTGGTSFRAAEKSLLPDFETTVMDLKLDLKAAGAASSRFEDHRQKQSASAAAAAAIAAAVGGAASGSAASAAGGGAAAAGAAGTEVSSRSSRAKSPWRSSKDRRGMSQGDLRFDLTEDPLGGLDNASVGDTGGLGRGGRGRVREGGFRRSGESAGSLTVVVVSGSGKEKAREKGRQVGKERTKEEEREKERERSKDRGKSSSVALAADNSQSSSTPGRSSSKDGSNSSNQNQNLSPLRIEMPVSPHTPSSSGFKSSFLSSMLSPRGIIGSWRPTKVGLLGGEISSLQERYLVKQEIGSGSYGMIRAVREKETGKTWACKSIGKEQIQHVHILMELCKGGDLFDRIKQRSRYEEKPAAAVLQQLSLVLRACHSLGVMHRDVKPENLLLCSPTDDVAVKVTDFGIAATIKSGAKLTEFIGSHMYMAPEVINKSYSAEADVWSAGVVLYVLLAGVPPFWASTESGVLDAIISKPLNFSFPPWPSISSEAKELIKEMLKKDPEERITLDAVLGKFTFH
ncbi:unnamed protein product [Closterium sp. NIES-53]